MPDLHSALKTTVLEELAAGGIKYIRVRLQNGKDDIIESLHARPTQYSTAGFQSTDFLPLIGFSRSACAFHHGECFCREIEDETRLKELITAIAESFSCFENAIGHLEACGLFVDQPEGWGYFYGKPAQGRNRPLIHCSGDGHMSPTSKPMKTLEDEFFNFAFTWIEGGYDKGWTTHCRAKHMPLSTEFQAVIEFLGGFNWFDNCPEYDFEGCWWRFMPFENRGDSLFDSNAEVAHRWFDAHATNFSAGIKGLLASHAILQPWNLSFLRFTRQAPQTIPVARNTTAVPKPSMADIRENKSGHAFDVAFSFAGTERNVAEVIATIVRENGFSVFYDNFYPEQLWGKDLISTFDRIYRKDSRYCVMFLSREYAQRMWTTHERRSATARALEERGNEYILPIKVEEVDIDGLSPAVGYVSLSNMSPEQIAELLIAKLRSDGGKK